ncbi:MAG: multicopper oxidase domain-containing protein [Deltaproteobacteria bacterium]|nr:multicopper oxidase domain-containing protein [Deltaproteobacteria bacterium]
MQRSKPSFIGLVLSLTAVAFWLGLGTAYAALPGGDLDPGAVPKYVAPLVKPPAMPQAKFPKGKGKAKGVGKGKSKIPVKGGKNIEYYEIAVREFQQQVLPPLQADGLTPIGPTTVWSYGPAFESGPDNTGLPVAAGGHYFYPSFTVEAKFNKPVRIKWVNELKHADGTFRPHILPVDPTLHWANPIGMVDSRPPVDLTDSYWTNSYLVPVPWAADVSGYNSLDFPKQYVGPVPIVSHLHGAHVTDDSDGYPEAWYLPAAPVADLNLTATFGTWYADFRAKFQARDGQTWEPGSAVFQYPNDQRATTLWFHDHTLGMTRLNVYAGPAGFYLLRGGPDDQVLDSTTLLPAVLPGPAPGPGVDPFGNFFEIPIVIQDRSFNADGSLFYPDNRAFFEGLTTLELQIPFWGETACPGPSDVSPVWQPEFFGNMMVVNGQTWPVLNVEPRRYRLRFLNGSNSRFLILQMAQDADAVPGIDDGNWTMQPLAFWQIGSDGGFLAAPANLDQLLLGPAERADVIVDFSAYAPGTVLYLVNVGPDEPFGGGTPGVDFTAADPASTGQVMQFVVGPAVAPDPTTPPQFLQLPTFTPPAPAGGPYNGTLTQVSLNEEVSGSVKVTANTLDCASLEAFGPTAALLGTYAAGTPTPLLWMDAITENPANGATQTWEIYNFTVDAHPIHLHLVEFQVVDRQPIDGSGIPTGVARAPEPWENGFKDTVIAYPGEVTRLQATFTLARGDTQGLFVWHCHILEHEDNEMMRPYAVGAVPMPGDYLAKYGP